MARSKRNRDLDKFEAGGQAVIALVILLAFAGGGIHGLGERIIALMSLLFFLVLLVAALAGIFWVIKNTNWSAGSQNQSSHTANHSVPRTASASTGATRTDRSVRPADELYNWGTQAILERLQKIDWYQFEKFCEALLRAEGYSVDRKGGAQPDGGVDLIATKFDGNDTLIQCKHWNAWKVGAPTVRQMLGSMTDFQVRKGAIYTMKGWTQPALEFARKHDIQLVSGTQLAERAQKKLSHTQLNTILNNDTHHCPKCESTMVWRTGKFDPFWGCSTYPRCRGILKHSGPR